MTARDLYRVAVVLLLAYFVGAAGVWSALPDRMPIHFGAAGAPDRWVATSPAAWFGLPVGAAGLTVAMWALGRLAARHPGLWAVPDRDRFLSLSADERAPITETMEAFLAAMAILVIVLFAELQVEMHLAATGRTDGLTAGFWVAFAVVMVGSVGGALWLQARIARLTESTGGGRSPDRDPA